MTRQTLRILLFFTLVFSFPIQAQQPFPFDETGYESAMLKARSHNKPVLYMFYASWCPHCHVMRDQVFPDPQVSDFAQKNFHVAAQDVEQGDGKALMRKYNVNSFPTFVLLDPYGKLLYGFSGEYKKEDFLKELAEAANPEKQLPFLAAAFEHDPSNGDKCLAYLMVLRKARQSTSEVASKYLSTQKESQLVSALNWKIIANGVSDMGSPEFQYVLKHQKEFASVSSQKRVNRKIDNIIMESLKPAAENGDTIAYNKVRPLAKAMNLRRADSLVFLYDKQIYERTRDWKAYKKATLTETERFAWNNYTALRNTAALYLAEITDKAALREAIKWAQRSSELQPSKEAMLQSARLYEKIEDIPNAVAWAQKAREFCESVGFGTKEADDLLNRLQAR